MLPLFRRAVQIGGMTSMAEEPNTGQDAATRRLERAVVLQLLSGDDARCQRAELADAIGGEAQALDDAIGRLCEAGVVGAEGADVWASPAARRIDELGLIAI
jgi:hypothetical protein